MQNPYIGHPSQLSGVEEHRLVGGKGDGQRLYIATNGLGLELTASPDRNGDITRLRCHGVNLSYMSPCGYVAPAFFDYKNDNFLRSFTAGFLTTCGLETIGAPSEDDGEQLTLHGSIANIPAERSWFEEDGEAIRLHTFTRDEVIFGRKLTLSRVVEISKKANKFTIHDEMANTGGRLEPLAVLYHMNLGYPLLDEDSRVTVPSAEVKPRNQHAADDLAHWARMEKPQAGYEERCYYHKFADGRGLMELYQPKREIGVRITFDARQLDACVEWKMMGERDYVLGLECGNCYPDGRAEARKSGMLKFLKPGESKRYEVNVEVFR